jgi:hypothetical protein
MDDPLQLNRLSQPRRVYDELEFGLIHLDEAPADDTCKVCEAPMVIPAGYLVVWFETPAHADAHAVCSTCAEIYAPTLLQFVRDIQAAAKA